MSISETIRDRLILNQVNFHCNDNISEYILEHELNALVEEVADKFEDVLKALVIDVDKDHNTQDTAKRVAKMFINEVFSGRYNDRPKTTAFPNANHYDELYITGPITVRSTCAHHFQPIKGKCFVGVFPGQNVVGLSKFNRIVDWVASRPQIQEEMTVQIADEIENMTEAEGVAVIIQAEHFCITHRGCREHENNMTTSVMRGKFRSDPSLKAEFLSILNQGYHK